MIDSKDLKVAMRALGFEPRKEEIKKLVNQKNAKNAQLRASGVMDKKVILRRGQLVEIKVPPDPRNQ